jgi:hypothetical protein
MDLKQRKLSKSEWEGIELPVSKDEHDILKLITEGFSNVNLKVNKTDSIFTHLKIEYSQQLEEFLYVKFFDEKIKFYVQKYSIPFICFGRKQGSNVEIVDNICYVNVAAIVKLKSSDNIRLSRLNSDCMDNDSIYEFILFKHFEQLINYKNSEDKQWMHSFYTINKLLKNNVSRVNIILTQIITTFMRQYESELDLLYIVKHSSEIIEKNPQLLKYSDLTLYDHQKEIFNAINAPNSKLILYIAPTGTGKTLTPLGLSEKYKMIYVCGARHVGLQLARSAISINKRVAFAFGCSAAEDVRLHYFAAKEYTKDKRSGQIRKVDNTVGDKVEIIICDIRSYLPAMYYMSSFNPIQNIVTYWDEPTITMDYQTHDLHKIIKKNWKENIIPNFVLSSATLPKMSELTETINDFKDKFPDATIENIVSHDCRKTIPLIDNNGYVVMPHYLHENYEQILEVVSHCEENLTLLRYFDLKESSNFIHYVETNNFNKPTAKFARNFASIDEIDMKNIKLYYLKMLKHIVSEQWPTLFQHFKSHRQLRISPNNTVDTKGNNISKPGASITRTNSVQQTTVNTQQLGTSGIYVTTKDAYTLTDGPTIFLANDLHKIAKFCIQQANIPTAVMDGIIGKINYNNQINERIDQIEKELEFEENKMATKLAGSVEDSSKEAKKLLGQKDSKNKGKIAGKIVDKTEDRKIAKMREDIGTLKSMIKQATIDDMFIPNKHAHIDKWAKGLKTSSSFTSNIEESINASIMMLKDVEDTWKILLLLGIGVFANHESIAYTEIMKKMADQQKLYLIIADSDYIYGTNYQFCHGYLSKDLEMTQEKIIQALGRIGRNNIQQEYSARFRDDIQIRTLFTKFRSEQKPEVINMNQLFNCKNVKWNGNEYEEFEEEVEEVEYNDVDEIEVECD